MQKKVGEISYRMSNEQQTETEQESALENSETGKKWQSYETVFTGAKAGMDGVDKDKVKRVVYEMSKDSAHFKNEQRKQAQVDERIRRLKLQASQISQSELLSLTEGMDKKLASLEANRDLTRTWFHVDMDAFFASVEELDNPALKSKPMAVGGKSMISTANYEARKYGVRSAMPGFIALRLCPQLVFVKPDFSKYKKASEATRKVFSDYDPNFEAGSLDEAYLDVTEYCEKSEKYPQEVACELRERVHKETGLTCSVGMAVNRMLAKVASDMHKPNGQFLVDPNRDAILDFVRKLAVRKVPGIGKVTEQVLSAFDITQCGDLFENRGIISALFSQSSCDFFMAVALGIGRTTHSDQPEEGEVGRKGISCERTFRAISSKDDLESKAAELAEHLACDMAREKLRGRTVTLKLKLTNFEVRTRAISLPNYISNSDEILKPVLHLLVAELPIEIRLMGIRVSNFQEDRKQTGQASIMDFVKKTGNVDQADLKGHEAPGQGLSMDICEATTASFLTHSTDAVNWTNSEARQESSHSLHNTSKRTSNGHEPPKIVQMFQRQSQKQSSLINRAGHGATACQTSDKAPGLDSYSMDFVSQNSGKRRRTGTSRIECELADGSNDWPECVDLCSDIEPDCGGPSEMHDVDVRDDVAVGLNPWVCPKCGESLHVEQKQEHADYHFAMALWESEKVELTSPLNRTPVSNRNKSKLHSRKGSSSKRNSVSGGRKFGSNVHGTLDALWGKKRDKS